VENPARFVTAWRRVGLGVLGERLGDENPALLISVSTRPNFSTAPDHPVGDRRVGMSPAMARTSSEARA